MIIYSLGTRCPQPIIEIAQALADHPEIHSFQLLSDDPATWPDLQAWARMTGHRVKINDEGDSSHQSKSPSYLIWR